MKRFLLAVQITTAMAACIVAMRTWPSLAVSPVSHTSILVIGSSFVIAAIVIPTMFRAIGIGAMTTLVGLSGVTYALKSYLNQMLLVPSALDPSAALAFGGISMLVLAGGLALLGYGSAAVKQRSKKVGTDH